MTFSLDEIRDLFCIVSINDDQDDVRVLRVSDDLGNDTLLHFGNGIALADILIDDDWYDSWEADTGVYKLTLDPVYTEGNSSAAGSSKKFLHFAITQVETLFTLA